MTGDNVASARIAPAHVRPEMIIRWLMANMDRIDQLVIVAKCGSEPMVVQGTHGMNPGVLAMGAAVLHDMALEEAEGHVEGA